MVVRLATDPAEDSWWDRAKERELRQLTREREVKIDPHVDTIGDSPGVLTVARFLREYCCQKASFPLELVKLQIESWRQDLGLPPDKYIDLGNQSGKTALHFAAQLRGDGIAQLLVSLRANVNATTARGHTALIYASGRGRDEVVACLLDAGARCCVRTANGDTALSMGATRLSDETLARLLKGVQDEQNIWLDFTLDQRAIEAQADHVQRSPHKAQHSGDMPDSVANVLAQRRVAEISPSDMRAADLAKSLFDLWGDSDGFANALMIVAGEQSRKAAGCVLKSAIHSAFQHLGSTELDLRFVSLLRVVSIGIPRAAQRMVEEGKPRKAKDTKQIATQSLLASLKDLRHEVSLSTKTLVAEAPPWMVVELLTPPTVVSLEDDRDALEDVLRSLCHVEAWSSSFSQALRWLAALRPQTDARPAAIEAFKALSSIFVDVLASALQAGRSLKRCKNERGDLLLDAQAVFGEDALKPLLDKRRQESLQVPGAALSFSPVPRKDFTGVASPILLPDSAEVVYVGDEKSWTAVAAELFAAPVIAIDTEWGAIGRGPALVQFALGDGLENARCFLFDCLTLPHAVFGALLALLLREDVEFLGWSFDEDRKRLNEVFNPMGRHECGECALHPGFPIADLQVACRRFLAVAAPPSLSLACSQILGRPLDKSEQCSDWCRRPLTEKQKHYAALDAAILLDLRSELARLKWM